jgi:DNA-binding NarL/FixJ family response regulator
LRELHHRAEAKPIEVPRVLGIDDWAWRKGHRYGTILCDLEKRKVIDLLPDRESETVVRWLRQHPGTEIVSRDRDCIYAEATRKAAPGAVQVADRWHLLRNLSEALKNALDPHHRLLAQAARASRTDEVTPAPVPHPGSTRELLTQQQNRQRRYDRYEQVRALMRSGVPKAEIARQMILDHRTVRKFMQAEIFPEAKPRIRRCIVDPYAEYPDRRLREGCRSPPASGGRYANKASAGRRTSSATGFYGAEVIAARLPLHYHKDLLFALHRDIQSGSCSKEQLQQSATSMSCTGLHPWSLHLRRWAGSSSASSGIVISQLSQSGLLRQRRLPWSASQIAWQEISRPSKQR